ncbi:Malonate-- ligase [Lecanosticta acicola]|uniref:Malonate-- ligase n=1 Tax=Lecanosticta acicola TaxID=111012 RepID=A0AAI8Z1C2_9PEZI|nr:Malonate-- ligase [Lecanosticta acicola]
MPPSPTSPSIAALFRQLEKRAINSSSTFERNPETVYKEDVLPLQTLLKEQWKMSSFDDRTLQVPEHTGKHIFPCHPLFNRLVRFAHANPPRLCVRDVNTGVEATHVQLLTDVLAFRERVWQNLSDGVKKALDQRQEVYIGILAPGGYEFTVAILAALALGAAVVPMTVALPPEEALYFATKSRAAAVLVSDGALRLGLALEKLVKDADPSSRFVCIPVAPSLMQPPLDPAQIIVSSDMYLDDNAPGVVIFTSGTTGPPKGAVMRRAFVHDEALSVVDHYNVTPDDILLHLLPVHHATGIGIMFFPFLIGGALLEFRSGSFNPEWTWERWRRGRNLFFSGVPTIYMRMMRYFQQNLSPRSDAQEYIEGARGVRTCICGTSALPKPIADFWAKLLDQNILLRYGMTETGAVFKVRMGDKNVPDGSVGNVFPGCDVRLSEGDQGEILAKSPGMFSKFLFDAEATAASHTSDGYYKTGDMARREGGYYFIMGRASVDIIKSGGYKISALDIEREILALQYAAEVMVVGVPDDEYGERVGAVMCLKGEKDMAPDDGTHVVQDLTIQKLRDDLRSRLAGYKLPTVLRIEAEELPKSGTGKVVKKVLGPRFFPPDKYKTMAEVQVWRRQDDKSKAHSKL